MFPPPSLRKRISLVAIFLATLLTTSFVIRQFLPFPKVEGIEAKLTWLAQHGSAYDTLFIGSSRIFWHVIPQEFDAAMRQAGHPTRSFNLGYNSLRPPEDSYVVEKALTDRTAPLRFVLVEADEVALKVRAEMVGTSRLSYWHDPRRMWALTQQALAANGTEAGWWASWDERRDAWELLGSHAAPFLARTTNLGRGEDLLPPPSDEPPKPRDWNRLVGPLRDGAAEERNSALSAKETKRFLAELKEQRERPTVAEEASQDLFEDMHQRIQATGARMILVVPPRVALGRYLPDPKRLPQISVFDFSDPTRYPQLFEPRYRYDEDHLNAEGAVVFSRLLAVRLIETLQATEPRR